MQVTVNYLGAAATAARLQRLDLKLTGDAAGGMYKELMGKVEATLPTGFPFVVMNGENPVHPDSAVGPGDLLTVVTMVLGG